jgi:hypothetical protein
MRDGKSRRHTAQGTIAGLLAIFIGACQFILLGSTSTDDVYITFSAARAFAEFGLGANINGDSLEQSTSLLQVLLLLPFALVGSPNSLPTLGWLLSISFFVLTQFLVFQVLRAAVPVTVALLGVLVVGFIPSWAYWSMSGMETSLVMTLVMLVLLWTQKISSLTSFSDRVVVLKSTQGGVLIFLVFAARPDAGLYIGAGLTIFALLTWQRSRPGQRQTLVLAGIAALTLIGLLTLIRFMAYGSILPQSVQAKSGRNPSEILEGSLGYLTLALQDYWFVIAMILAVVALLLIPFRDLSISQLLLCCLALTSLAGALSSGGDWMPFGRFLVIFQVLLVLLLITFLPRLPRSKATALSLTVVALMLVNYSTVRNTGLGSSIGDRWQVMSEQDLSAWPPASTRFNLWNATGYRDALFLNSAMGVVRALVDANSTVTIGSGQGGMVFYYLKEEFGDSLRFSDRYSLLTDDFVCEDLRSSSFGREITWERWIESTARCSPALPDVVFDLGEFPDSLSDRYYLIIQIQGQLARHTGRGHANTSELGLGQWLAISKDLTPPTPEGS